MREQCPHCGADLEPGALSCPECGSDEQTGWSEAAENDNLGLPDDSFDYDDFVRRELRSEGPVPRGVHWFWWLIAVALVAMFVLFWFLR
ncbi:MAG TPA: zinc-ribbon domain-containing protein [Patescibacteria group bacterium]|nr:zinc-ribbon domain-containing protein [Patescibacteria group bacterium]